MLVVVVVAGVFVVFFWTRFLPVEAGYAGSRSRPPWVWIYCPQIVDDLISRWDVLGGCFGFGFLSTEAAVGGPAGFLAEREAVRTARLVEFGTVGSSQRGWSSSAQWGPPGVQDRCTVESSSRIGE